MFKYIIFVMTVLSGLLIHVSGLEVIVKMLVIAVDLIIIIFCQYNIVCLVSQYSLGLYETHALVMETISPFIENF